MSDQSQPATGSRGTVDHLEWPTEGYDHVTDVLVVGSGPAGATAALALATEGVRVTVVNRYNWVANSPRAHITNQRALEVMRDLGVEAEAHRVGTPWDQMAEMVFTRSVVGDEIARLSVWGNGPDRRSDYLMASPCPILDIPQPLMEPVLVSAAAERGARLITNTEYLALRQDADGVDVLLLDRASGRRYTVRAAYVVGADGANSRVADDIGLPIEGRMGRAGTVYARFRADLAPWIEHRPGILHRILISAFGEMGLRTLRAIGPWHDWIAGWGFDIDGPDPDLSHEHALEVIREMIGDPSIPVEIDNVTPWKVNQAHATRYSNGRVFCAGDAVHRHPPSSGLGSNTSMQDAFNLGWKLAYAVKGWAGAQLLDSYSDERVPVGAAVVERANQSRRDYQALNELLRPNPAFDGRVPIDLVDESTPDGVAAREALAEAIRVKNFEFNAEGIELNHFYESGAIIDDGSGGPQLTRDRTLYAHASTRPGAKIPHAWLVDERGRRISTLDVIGKGLVSVVTGVGGAAWADAVEALDLPYLRVVRIGSAGMRDAYGTWRDLRDIHETGALLVRPDGHIAWRHQGEQWDAAQAHSLLVDALRGIGLTVPLGAAAHAEAERIGAER